MKVHKFSRPIAVLVGWTLAFNVFALGEKPLKIIVPAPAGGSMDIAARLIGQQISTDIGRPVIVENRAGASGSIGLQTLLQAAPDGDTIAMGATNLIVEIPQLMKVPYDPLKDIVTIARIAQTNRVLVSSATYSAKDLPSLITHLKTRRGKSSFASFGTGTSSQYAGLIFSNQADLEMQHVGYNGSPPALQDVLGGQVDIMFDSMLTSLPLIKSGKLRAYAIAGKSRSKFLPEIPTMSELGYPEIQFPGQINIYGSSKLPADVLSKIQTNIKNAMNMPSVQKKLLDVGLEPDLSIDSAALLSENKSLFQRNAAIVKKYQIKPN